MVTGFSLDIYNCDIAFAWDTNDEELKQLLDQGDVPQDLRDEFFDTIHERDVGAITCALGTKLMVVIFNNKPTEGVIAHELFHAAYRILEPRGIKDEEAYAYVIGHITNMFYELYRKGEEET